MSAKKSLAAGAMGLALLAGVSACRKQPFNFVQPALTLEDRVRLEAVAKEVAAIPCYWAESDSVGYGKFDHKDGDNYFLREFWSYKKDGSALRHIEIKLGEVVEFANEGPLQYIKFKKISSYIVFAKGGKTVKVLPFDSDYISRMNELWLAEAGKK